jgi:hypothetical protein
VLLLFDVDSGSALLFMRYNRGRKRFDDCGMATPGGRRLTQPMLRFVLLEDLFLGASARPAAC